MPAAFLFFSFLMPFLISSSVKRLSSSLNRIKDCSLHFRPSMIISWDLEKVFSPGAECV